MVTKQSTLQPTVVRIAYETLVQPVLSECGGVHTTRRCVRELTAIELAVPYTRMEDAA